MFLFIHKSKIIYFSRNPVGSDEEAIYVKENYPPLREAYERALLASGFNKSKGAFRPCPLGTFTNPLNNGVETCQNCPPGKF